MSIAVDVVTALKGLLRARGITYRELARRLALSEAAVKRMFSLRALSLARLEQVCDVLGVGIAELADEASRDRGVLVQLDVAQEKALVDDPRLLLALFLCINRWRADDVIAQFAFTRAQWSALLARLDRLGIIELQPGDRVRTRTARNFRWRADGPMERHFRHHLLSDYFADPFDGEQDALLLLSGSLSREGAAQMRQHLNAVAREFDALLARDAGLPASERMGISLVIAQKPWVLRAFEPWRKAEPSP